jgi:hypothetical protein
LISVLTGSAFHFLSKGGSRPKVSRTELDRPTQMRNSFVEPASRRLELAEHQLDFAVLGRKVRCSLNQRHRGFELAEADVR